MYSIKNLCLIAYGKFNKTVTCWAEKIPYINQGWTVWQAKEEVLSGLSFRDAARVSFWEFRTIFCIVLLKSLYITLARVTFKLWSK